MYRTSWVLSALNLPCPPLKWFPLSVPADEESNTGGLVSAEPGPLPADSGIRARSWKLCAERVLLMFVLGEGAEGRVPCWQLRPPLLQGEEVPSTAEAPGLSLG